MWFILHPNNAYVKQVCSDLEHSFKVKGQNTALKNPSLDNIISFSTPCWLILHIEMIVGKGCAVTLNQVSISKVKVRADLGNWIFYHNFSSLSPILIRLYQNTACCCRLCSNFPFADQKFLRELYTMSHCINSLNFR